MSWQAGFDPSTTMEKLIETLSALDKLIRTRASRLDDAQDYCLVIDDEVPADLIHEIEALTFQADQYSKSEVKFPLNQKNIKFFWQESDLIKRIDSKDFTGEKDLFLFNSPDKPLLFISANSTCYLDFKPVTNNFLFQNIQSYFSLLQFFKGQEHQEDKPFYLVDHFSEGNRLIVMTTSQREGKLTIPFQKVCVADPKSSLKSRLQPFFDVFEDNNKTLPKFVKAEFFKQLSPVNQGERMAMFIGGKVTSIVEEAQKNFEVYINDLSLTKFKSDYRESQEKYFASTREILGKVSNQVIAFPLSITATAFATNKLGAEETTPTTWIILLLIILAFSVFTGYSAYLMSLQRQDAIELEDVFTQDFDRMMNNQFFNRFETERPAFREIRQKLIVRFSNLKRSITIYVMVMILFNSLFIGFMLFQLAISIKWAVLLSLLLMLFFGWLFFHFPVQFKSPTTSPS